MATCLSIADICEHLRVSRWTVIRLIKAKAITAQKDGNSVQIDPASYLHFLQRNTVPARDERTPT